MPSTRELGLSSQVLQAQQKKKEKKKKRARGPSGPPSFGGAKRAERRKEGQRERESLQRKEKREREREREQDGLSGRAFARGGSGTSALSLMPRRRRRGSTWTHSSFTGPTQRTTREGEHIRTQAPPAAFQAAPNTGAGDDARGFAPKEKSTWTQSGCALCGGGGGGPLPSSPVEEKEEEEEDSSRGMMRRGF